MDVYAAFQEGIRQHEVGDFPITERGPLTDRAFYYRDLMPDDAKRRDYDKNQLTDVLMTAHGEGRARVSVYRLPFVYGPRDPQYPGRHGPVIQRLLARRATMLMGHQAQNRVWTYGHVTNVAAAIVHALGREVVDGRIYNIGERAWRSHRRWATLFAEAAGAELAVRLLPDHLLDPEEGRDQPPLHLIIDSARFGADTGFVEPLPLAECVATTLAWAREHPECLGPTPDWAAEEALLQAYDAALARVEGLRPASGAGA